MRDDRPGIPAPELKGRGTRIVRAKMDPISKTCLTDKQLIIKVCWPEKSRLNESDVIQYARELLLSKKENEALVENLPHLIATREVPEGDTGLVLELLNLDTPETPDHGSRIFRMHLFSQLLPVTKLSDENFMKAWLDCVKCHYALWNEGFDHGNISIWNMMWDETPGAQCGILNDWDLACVRGGFPCKTGTGEVKIGKGGELRTGTLPFMARDLLQNHYDGVKASPTVRLYRHEVESFIWVFIWWCIMTKGDEAMKEGLNNWRTGTPNIIRALKNDYLSAKTVRPDKLSEEKWQKSELLLEILNKIGTIKKHYQADFEPSSERVYQLVVDIMSGKIVKNSDVKFGVMIYI